MVNILIVDDHAVVRGGLKQFLAESADLKISGEAGSAQEALPLIRDQAWDLVMLDISLQDLNGLELLKLIKREKPNLPVLVFSMHSEDDFAMTVFKAGAAGYLEKDSSPEEILEAIRKVAKGAKYVGPRLADKLLAGTASSGTQLNHDSLSKREFEVMLLLSRGMRLTDIAERLHLSVKTISSYRTRVLEKMELDSNADMTRYVIQHKLDSQAAAH